MIAAIVIAFLAGWWAATAFVIWLRR